MGFSNYVVNTNFKKTLKKNALSRRPQKAVGQHPQNRLFKNGKLAKEAEGKFLASLFWKKSAITELEEKFLFPVIAVEESIDRASLQ